MHKTSYAKMKAFVRKYLEPAAVMRLDIVDVGAQAVQGMKTYRPLFARPGWRYRGLDLTAGDNVDLVLADPYHWLELADDSVDVVISGQAFEHIEYPWRTIAEIARILKPGGLACLIVPSAGPVHQHPLDCWRIYPDGMKALAKSAGLRPVEVFTDWGLLPWQDTFAVLQKDHDDKSIKSKLPPCKNRKAALSVYRAALRNRPSEPVYYRKLAAILDENGDTEGAATCLRVGGEQCPAHPELRQEAARAFLKCGRVGAALEQVVHLLNLPFPSPSAVNIAGKVFAALDERDRDYCTALLPADRQALQRLARLADTRGRYLLSSVCWRKLTETEGYESMAAIGAAAAMLGCNQRSEGVRAFRAVCRHQIDAGSINRTTVIQRIIDAMQARVYLEIGVQGGLNFFQIDAPVCLAVDPQFQIPGGAIDFDGFRFFATTSDHFFSDPPPELRRHGLDVALIDGLHTYDQSLRDVGNCLRFLNPEGVIILHDCLPASAAEAHPDRAIASGMDEYNGQWTGDVYRTIIHLRSLQEGVRVAVLATDHGIALVERGTPERPLSLGIDAIGHLGYDDLIEDAGHLLNLKRPSWFEQWLQERQKG